MKVVSLTKLKSTLSEQLGYLKGGQDLIVLDRGVPIARLTPLSGEEAFQANCEGARSRAEGDSRSAAAIAPERGLAYPNGRAYVGEVVTDRISYFGCVSEAPGTSPCEFHEHQVSPRRDELPGVLRLGAWLISLGAYTANTLRFSAVQTASIYGTMAIASLFMPALLGTVADRWLNAERLLGLCHVAGAGLLLWASAVSDYGTLYLVMFLNAMVFVPTIALNNTVSYIVLRERQYDPVKDFPPIRVWGTVGFIAAMWLVDLAGWTQNPAQFYVSAAAGLTLGVYCFTLPPCPPAVATEKRGLASSLGLNAFVLFRNPTMLVFFVFALLLGAALQITNMFGAAFLDDFKASYPDSFGVQHTIILLSVSQISETLFILTIPFFLKRFGIKKVMLLSIFAWVLRFGLFAIGNPGSGLILLILSMIVYGMAFDFFNVSGSLFVEREADPKMRASAQGLFMLMTNGVGPLLGSILSGMVVDSFTENGMKDWRSIWLTFAAYALALGIVFPFLFRYRHDAKALANVRH